jgi:hypothetical protein
MAANFERGAGFASKNKYIDRPERTIQGEASVQDASPERTGFPLSAFHGWFALSFLEASSFQKASMAEPITPLVDRSAVAEARGVAPLPSV